MSCIPTPPFAVSHFSSTSAASLYATTTLLRCRRPPHPQYTQGAGYKANQLHYESHLNLTGKVLNEQQPAAARAPVLQSTADPNAPCPSPKTGKEWSGKTGMVESDKFDLPKPKSSGVPEVSKRQ